ncbi:peptidoglycan DD-metalloendopeptidase family protein [Pseudoalteromonas luteoviolacea]|uniref:Peptidase M23 n=1 Tax=Pseudoalteromonas luteoviolacea H33 TaxID=1365251 RepID=A0A167FCI3_9GAMM|nr:peptidoglycan DD-metalloendopeptidase family protein [Pseudoalteromonas luteoviolacea]KZN52057.1 peptidase M23 [Pseudoalteromonas luteoviolacea H33]KZN78773.1 peptidase M23 [Pseudoalteromonas luteoviolacea H33-S]MBQ4876137.1 peptidoglycan DD-metalloendopeptidase family protein [Pseudoalteromonas luteoviolacea]MBQ4905772.1 peptidoglycan DD-metalloendopeptidase family protein [Pseudoalteromonas luteoviolacea]
MVPAVNKLPKKHKMLIVGLLAAMVGIALLPSEKATASKDHKDDALEVGKRYELPIKVEEQQPEQLTTLSAEIKKPEKQESTTTYDYADHKVRSGDSLAVLFKRAGYSAQTLHNLVNTNEETRKLTKIHPGETLSFASDAQGNLAQLKYVLSKTDTLYVTRNESGQYATQITSKEIETREKTAGGKIRSSFWTAGISAGLTQRQIMNFANIFGWDVDFANDIRKGDSFTLVYESHYVDGEEIGNGKIIAAEFMNQGDRYTAIRHTNGEFYTPEGRSMKKAFLRAPVNFKYISSNFNPRRLHPVTKQVRPHRGIDYAAKVGTPVVAAGNGRVTKAGFNRLNGNYVFIEHGSQYTTKYLHLHKLHVKSGQKVKQGQKIGTVGATGRVTGPHLHYEFLVDGTHRNPRTVKLPKSLPLPKQELAKFKPLAEQMLVRLERKRELMLALNDK